MKPFLLMMAPVPMIEGVIDRDFEVVRLFDADDAEARLAAVAPQVRAVVTNGGTGLDRVTMDRLPALEIIAVNGVGVDAIDMDEARRRGIEVAITTGALTEDVAELGIGLILAVLRRLCANDRFVRDGSWRDGRPWPLGRRMAGSRIGIIGMGRIGRALASRAAAFEVEIAYSARHPDAGLPYRYEQDVRTLAAASDILVLCLAATPETRGSIDAAVLAALGPDGILINVARGSVVDEPALVEALVQGRIAGAGLDVFADEPAVPEALFALDNVVLQPHAGSATHEARRAMADQILASLAAHFGINPPA